MRNKRYLESGCFDIQRFDVQWPQERELETPVTVTERLVHLSGRSIDFSERELLNGQQTITTEKCCHDGDGPH